MKFQDIPQMSQAHYSVHCSWKYFEEQYLQKERCGESLNLDPDYQRGLVWTKKQKSQYIEWILRGGLSGKDIYLNFPGWMTDYHGHFEVVDGKQRLYAALDFIHNKVRAFGKLYKEFGGYFPEEACFTIHINNLESRKEILQWYLDMNSCGVAHTSKELEKVRELIKKEEKK